jgi:hypothetical protein
VPSSGPWRAFNGMPTVRVHAILLDTPFMNGEQ